MKVLDRFVNETDEKKILKKSAILNSIAGVISSTFVSILLMVITRTGSIELAGIFSIASVIAYQCLTIGSFATYNVQASDLKREFHFNDYAGIRVISIFLMMCLLLFYSFCSGYDLNKAWIVFSFGLFKMSDIVDDLFRAEYHRNHRLDVASFILVGRYLIAIALFSFIFILSKNLLFTSLLSGFILMFFTLWIHRKYLVYFVKERIMPRFSKIFDLGQILLPLTISNYIRMYVVNIPKYTIDLYLSTEIQTYYSILVMPAMIINLLAEIIFAPFIPRLAEYWEFDTLLFNKMIVRQLLMILGITGCTIAGGWIIGLDLLSLAYSVDLSSYMVPLFFLLSAGGFNAASLFMSLVLTVQRKQKATVVIYFIITVIALMISKSVVLNFGIMGASFIYLLICGMNFIGFLLIVMIEINKKLRG